MPHPAAATSAVDLTAHADHDPLLVAAYATGDATGAELETATALVAACPACAALDHDLRAITAALPLMPAPRRTRDFRLTAEQAASIRPAGWRRLLAPFAGPRFAFAAPLGSGLAALGLVGILLAGTGLPLGGATAGAGGESKRTSANGAEMATAPASEAQAPSPEDAVMAQGEPSVPGAPDASIDPQLAVQPADPLVPSEGAEDAAAMDANGSAIPMALAVSLFALLAGLVLVALRFAGRSALRTR